MDIQALFDEASEQLLAEDAEVEPGRMFASDGLRTGGRFFAMVSRGEVVVKLPEPRVDELVSAGEGRPFEAGRRRMREWISLRPPDAETCAGYVTEARDFVRSLQPSRV